MQTKILLLLLLSATTLWSQNINLNKLSGSWHMRVMDGMEVRKARAILDFHAQKMKLDGFDACNRISGSLIENTPHNISIPLLRTTRMACRGKMQNWVSNRLHEALKEGFDIKEEKKYGVEGITLKSATHELFFKRMERE